MLSLSGITRAMAEYYYDFLSRSEITREIKKRKDALCMMKNSKPLLPKLLRIFKILNFFRESIV